MELRRQLEVPASGARTIGRSAEDGELHGRLGNQARLARFLLLAPFETGSRVRLSLEPRMTGGALTLEGEVRWRARSGDGWAHGVEFAGLTPELRERLAQLGAEPPHET